MVTHPAGGSDAATSGRIHGGFANRVAQHTHSQGAHLGILQLIPAGQASSYCSTEGQHLCVIEADNLGDKIGPVRSQVLWKGVDHCDEPGHCISYLWRRAIVNSSSRGRPGHELRLAAVKGKASSIK